MTIENVLALFEKLKEVPLEMSKLGEQESPPQARVFINDIHTYSSKYIAKYLDACVVGCSLHNGNHVEKKEDVEDEKSLDQQSSKTQDPTFRIVGTTSGEKEEKYSFIAEEYANLTREELFPQLMSSNVIIYNITEHVDQIEEASWAATALHNEISSFAQPKIFILISTVMTWALSKPADPRNPTIAKDDYQKRKPHSNFNEHFNLEKNVLQYGKTNRSQLITYVVASGLLYGMGEKIFDYFFQKSYFGDDPKVPVFGDSSNLIPTIHVSDLAGIIQNLIDHKPKAPYFLAVDESKNTLEEILTAIALGLGSGKMEKVPKEDISQVKDFTQAEIDSLFVNLRLDANFQKDNFNINWVAPNGIVKDIEQVVDEYRLSRGLQPVRVCVLGPPAVGKSTVAEKICRHYKLQHVKLMETIEETFAALESCVNQGSGETVTDEFSHAVDFLEILKKNKEAHKGFLDEQYVIRIMKDKLNSRLCKNQGFVLDGFPKSYEQAKKLFSADCGKTAGPRHNSNVIPEFVFSLDASDAFLKERVLTLPKSLLDWITHPYKNYLSSLARFRMNNSKEDNVLNYFTESEIHPVHIEITSDVDQDYTPVMEKVERLVGEPKDVGYGAEVLEKEERRRAEAALRERVERIGEEVFKEEEQAALRTKHWEEWIQYHKEKRKQEEEFLVSQPSHMRFYLQRRLMPLLTRALSECCTSKPENPQLFLGELLRKPALLSTVQHHHPFSFSLY